MISQHMIYDRKNVRRSLEFISPPQNGLRLTHIVMHAHDNGYWHDRQLEFVNINISMFFQLQREACFRTS